MVLDKTGICSLISHNINNFKHIYITHTLTESWVSFKTEVLEILAILELAIKFFEPDVSCSYNKKRKTCLEISLCNLIIWISYLYYSSCLILLLMQLILNPNSYRLSSANEDVSACWWTETLWSTVWRWDTFPCYLCTTWFNQNPIQSAHTPCYSTEVWVLSVVWELGNEYINKIPLITGTQSYVIFNLLWV